MMVIEEKSANITLSKQLRVNNWKLMLYFRKENGDKFEICLTCTNTIVQHLDSVADLMLADMKKKTS